jgi:hypothetical protein
MQQARAMPLNTKQRFLISPELGNQFILISILTPRRAAWVDCECRVLPDCSLIRVFARLAESTAIALAFLA